MLTTNPAHQRDFDVIAVGELNVDLILACDGPPEFGQVEKVIADATLTIGSSTAIFACGAARLGLRVAFVGKVGDDDFGRFMLREMTARGVDMSAVVVDPDLKTGLSVILSTGHDRAILTHLGSISALRYAEIDHSLLGRGRHLHLGSYFLLDAFMRDVPVLLDQAHARGLTTSLDTNYDPTEQWDGGLGEVLRRTDVFLPNVTELCAIAGTSDIESALEKIGVEVPVVAIKRGAQGGIGRWRGTNAEASSIPIDVVDTTGAGDSFDAGFVYAYLAGWGLERALRLACMCGALSTRAAGGTTAQPTLEEALGRL